MRAVFEVAHQMGIVPLAWLLVHTARGKEVSRDYWWMAVALGVSWVTDWAAHFVNPWLPAIVYPVAQLAIVATIFCSKRDAARLILVTVLSAIVAILRPGAFKGPEVLATTIAFLGACAAVWNGWQKDELRRVVLINFGLGWLAWVGIALYPVISRWPTWLAYQGCRAVAIGWFCFATVKASRQLGVVRGGLARSVA